MERAAGILETGGVLTPKALETGAMDLETAGSRQELDRVFTGWLERAERRIARLEPAEQCEMRQELAEITTGILRDLGDVRGAELVLRAPRSELYRTQVLDEGIRRGTVTRELTERAAQEVRSAVLTAAGAIGRPLSPHAPSWFLRRRSTRDRARSWIGAVEASMGAAPAIGGPASAARSAPRTA